MLYRSHGTSALPAIRAAWEQSATLEAAAAEAFPLAEAETADLLADLADRLGRIHRAEIEALDALRVIIA